MLQSMGSQRVDMSWRLKNNPAYPKLLNLLSTVQWLFLILSQLPLTLVHLTWLTTCSFKKLLSCLDSSVMPMIRFPPPPIALSVFLSDSPLWSCSCRFPLASCHDLLSSHISLTIFGSYHNVADSHIYDSSLESSPGL